MRASRRIGVILTTACALWSLSFVIFGATPTGKAWYANLASKFFDDSKGGVPVMMLAIPVLLASSASVLLNVRSVHHQISEHAKAKLPCHLPMWIHRLLQRWSAGSGDLNFSRVFVCIPLVVFLLANVFRRLCGLELSLDEKLKEASNSFASMALIAMSYFLIPVARQSPLLKFLNWSPVAAVRLHIWSGRIIIVGVVAHGAMHMIRWSNLSGENLVRMTFPPAPCWTLGETNFEPTCNDTLTDCSCYQLFRNLTGFLGLLGLLVIAATTVSYVRRNHYRVFYMAHVLAAPTVLFMVILHWRRSILYMAPSLLYYAANSAPLLTESAFNRNDSGVKILAVKCIASRDRHRQRLCVSLTLTVSDDASLNFVPGQYVKLLAPEVSSISHPFTINRVPGKCNQMRIIFRATGPFTHLLARSLTSGVKLPCIRIDGFHGTTHRVDQVLKHDVAALVAGGIGITPYLSLLHEVVSVMALRQPPKRSSVTKEVVLHWMCRDQALLEYVKAQYFDPLHWNPSKGGCRIRIIVHNTHRKLAENSLSDSAEIAQELTMATDNDGLPFTPSRFSSGKTTSMFGNFLSFVTFAPTAWVGLWATWRLYMTVTSDHEILGRLWTALAITSIAVVVALLANFAAQIFDRVRARPLNLGLLEKASQHEDIEMESGEEGFAKQPLVASLNNNVEADSNPSMVTYEETVGRPTVHELLECFDGVRCPGLFVCGPKQLMRELRDAADERCQIRIRHCISGTPQIAIYEERFEL